MDTLRPLNSILVLVKIGVICLTKTVITVKKVFHHYMSSGKSDPIRIFPVSGTKKETRCLLVEKAYIPANPDPYGFSGAYCNGISVN